MTNLLSLPGSACGGRKSVRKIQVFTTRWTSVLPADRMRPARSGDLTTRIDPHWKCRRGLLKSSGRRPRPPSDVVPFQLSVKGRAADAEHPSCQGFVTLDLLEYALNGRPLNIFQIRCRHRF